MTSEHAGPPGRPGTGAPLRVGILRDHPTAGGEPFQRVLRLAFADARATGRLVHDVELVEAEADGLPRGTAAAVEQAFALLEQSGAVALLGPAISDNGLVARDLADAARLPCINYTGGEQTRSEWMFQYQVGSLEEEPAFIADHLAAAAIRRIALVDDRSLVARRYVEYFRAAASRLGLEVARQERLDPGADLPAMVARLRDEAADALVYLGLWMGARQLALEMATAAWRPRVVANSALMFGHASPDWRREWEGWRYVDGYSDDNPVLEGLLSRGAGIADIAPVTAGGAYDMGRLLADGIAWAAVPTRQAVKEGLERVKLVPTALGEPRTTMGFGRWDRAALKGPFLVMREWREARSLQVR